MASDTTPSNSQAILLSNTTWAAGSVVNLTGEVQIAPGVVLSVEPGVTINANGHKITAYGTLKLAGTQGAPIKLDKAVVVFGSSPGTPGDIQFNWVEMTSGNLFGSVATGYGRFDLADSKFTGVSGFYIWYPSSPSSITRNVFDGSEGLSIGTNQAGTITVTNNVFASQTGGAAVEVWANYNNGITVSRNSFLSTDRVAIELPQGFSSASLIATNNYFGTSSTSTINAMILDRTDSLERDSVVNYSPFLNQPDPATPVFQRVNTAPVAANATSSTNEDTTLTASLPAATDGESDPVTYAKATNPSNGTATVTMGGSYTYTPTANYNGTDNFSYTVSDGQGGANTYTVSLTVNAVNDAPVASGGSLAATEDTAATGSLTATDVDNASLSFSVVSAPSHGSVTLGANGSYTYTPAANYNGTDSFSFKASDGALDSNTTTVSITVAAVNDAPVLASPIPDQSVTLGSSLAFTFAAGAFTDVDSASLTYSATRTDGTALPAWLSFNPTTRAFSGTPVAGDLGTVSVRVTASDGSLSASDTFDVTVAEVKRAVSGVVQDGYVAGASIFVDRNGNGRPDAGEDTGLRTDAAGNFTGSVSGNGNLIAVGGTNIDTGLRNTLTLTAPQGASVISPVTTLVQTLVSSQSLTAAQAQQKVAQAFGIDAGTDLLRFDPLASAASGTSGTSGPTSAALAVQKANAQVALTAGLVDNPSTVMSGLARVVAQASAPVDLSKTTTLAQVTSGLNVSTTLQTAIAQGNAQVQAGSDLTAVAQAQKTTVTAALPTSTDWAAPTVSAFSPADGATGVAVASNLTLTFNEAVQRGSGTISLRRADGLLVEQFDAATSTRLTVQGSTVTLDPSVDLSAATGYYLEVAPGSVKDLAGNAFIGSSSYDFATSASRTATSAQALATVTSTADGGKVVVKIEPSSWSAGSNGFSLRVGYDAGLYSLSNYGLVGSGSSASSGSVSEVGNLGSAALTLSLSNGLTNGAMKLVFTPKAAGATTFGVTLSNVVINSAAGSLTVPTLSLDTQGPQATKWLPSDGAKAVPVGSNLNLTFNELIQRGTGAITLKTADGKVVETFTAANATVSVSTLTLNPTADLSIFTKYVVELGAGAVKDLAGNGNAADSRYDFQTATVDGLYHFFVVAFAAAPGATYMGQLAEAVNYGLSLAQIVEIFTTKPQFTGVSPTTMTHRELATQLVNNIVKTSASEAARNEAIGDIEAVLSPAVGWSRGKMLYTVFGNLASKQLNDPVWGGTAQQFQKQLAVARHFTEEMGIATETLATLRGVIGNVTPDTDVSTVDKIVQIIGTVPPGG